MPRDHDPLELLAAESASGARAEFRRALIDCDTELVALGSLLAERIVPTTSAFLEADAHAAEGLIVPSELDRRCRDLEDRLFELLARQAPVAGDLRHIVALLRSVADVQRSGHLLAHVAESLTWIHPPSMATELRDTVSQLGDVAAELTAAAVLAWRTHDGLAANELAERDDEVDLLQKLLLTSLYTGQQSVEEAVSLALIARYYERIADHAVEMARQVSYYVTGDRIVDG